MISRFRSRDPRLVGALVALGLDIALLALAAILVLASVFPAVGLVPAGAIGLAVAPFLGWRHGRVAAGGAAAGWPRDALRCLLLIAVAVVLMWVAIQGFTVSAEGGIGGRVAFVAYAILMDTIIVGALTLVAALPLGVAWARLMARVAG